MTSEDVIEQMKDEFPGNSRKSKIAPIREKRSGKKLPEEVEDLPRPKVRAQAIVKKKSLAQSIAHSFLNNDTKGIIEFLLVDVLIPAGKTTLQEIIQTGMDMWLYGETKPRSKGRDNGRSVISYNRMYRSRDEEEDRPTRFGRPSRDKFGIDDIYFRHGPEAEEVLDAMGEHLEKYDEVSVGDLFDFANVEGVTHVHYKWGWRSLKKAYFTHTKYGYKIVLPEPEELD